MGQALTQRCRLCVCPGKRKMKLLGAAIRHSPRLTGALSALNISTITSTVMLYWWDDKGGGGGGGMRYECLRNAREP